MAPVEVVWRHVPATVGKLKYCGKAQNREISTGLNED
jgi:hypothetical protein